MPISRPAVGQGRKGLLLAPGLAAVVAKASKTGGVVGNDQQALTTEIDRLGPFRTTVDLSRPGPAATLIIRKYNETAPLIALRLVEPARCYYHQPTVVHLRPSGRISLSEPGRCSSAPPGSAARLGAPAAPLGAIGGLITRSGGHRRRWPRARPVAVSARAGSCPEAWVLRLRSIGRGPWGYWLLLIARRSTGPYGPDLQRCPGTAHQPGGQQDGDKALHIFSPTLPIC